MFNYYVIPFSYSSFIQIPPREEHSYSWIVFGNNIPPTGVFHHQADLIYGTLKKKAVIQ